MAGKNDPIKGMFSQSYQSEDSEVYASRSELAAIESRASATSSKESATSASISATSAASRNAELNAASGHALNDIAAMYAIPTDKLFIYPTVGNVTNGSYYLYNRDGLVEVWKAKSTVTPSDPQSGNFELLPSLNRGGVLLSQSLSGASSYTIDASAGSVTQITLTARNTGITFSNTPTVVGKTIELDIILKQGAGANLVSWPSNIKWQNGRVPVLSYELDSEDVVTITWVNGDPNPYGFFVAGWL